MLEKVTAYSTLATPYDDADEGNGLLDVVRLSSSGEHDRGEPHREPDGVARPRAAPRRWRQSAVPTSSTSRRAKGRESGKASAIAIATIVSGIASSAPAGPRTRPQKTIESVTTCGGHVDARADVARLKDVVDGEVGDAVGDHDRQRGPRSEKGKGENRRRNERNDEADVGHEAHQERQHSPQQRRRNAEETSTMCRSRRQRGRGRCAPRRTPASAARPPRLCRELPRCRATPRAVADAHVAPRSGNRRRR